MDSKQASAVHDVIEYSSEVGGNVAPVLAGIWLAGTPGALVGAILSPAVVRLLSRTGTAVYEMVTGIRGRTRAAFGALHAISKIQERLELGETIRNDGFFSNDSNVSKADQILEGIMIKCRDAYEEKKSPFIANIFVCGAFDTSYSAEELTYLLNIAEQLTFRQYALLRIFSLLGKDKMAEVAILTDRSFRSPEVPATIVSVLNEIAGLIQMGLLSYKHAMSFEQMAELDPMAINPARVRITSFGRRLASALGVEDIDEQEKEALITLLSTEIAGGLTRFFAEPPD